MKKQKPFFKNRYKSKSSFVPEGCQQVQMYIAGLTCSADAYILRKELLSLPGIKNVIPLPSKACVYIQYEAIHTDISKVREAIQKLGYKEFPNKNRAHYTQLSYVLPCMAFMVVMFFILSMCRVLSTFGG